MEDFFCFTSSAERLGCCLFYMTDDEEDELNGFASMLLAGDFCLFLLSGESFPLEKHTHIAVSFKVREAVVVTVQNCS